MDYIKIGNFIMNERRAKNLTQAKLAKMIFVSEKTISKWEKGNGIPDVNILLKLCTIFEVSINEILNGERILSENYEHKAETKLIEIQKSKELSDKVLLKLEILIGCLGLIFLSSFITIAIFIQMAIWLKVMLIIYGYIVFISTCLIALKIEQAAGFYECNNCHHKYIPSYKQIFSAKNKLRKRYLKCPNCQKKSWHNKVLK